MNVKEIQESLKAVGFNPGPIDGVMGRSTRQAVREFQKKNHLRVDGILGPITLNYLGHGAIDEEDEEDKEEAPPKGRKLLNNDGVDQPKAQRPIHTLVIHCTATPEGREFSREQINQMHVDRGFSKIGYHRLIHLDGTVDIGRYDNEIGAHVAGHNTGSLGFSYVGGLNRQGKAKDTRTFDQKQELKYLIEQTAIKYNLRSVVGHRDLSPDKDHDGIVEPWEWIKQCPCFDVIPEYGHLLKRKK